ncbi:hypothetical protein [Pseudarthrobacter raffinosi]|uniref:hypothetical protein n=1 Tax=Pseudarthrobacter raffinosi TaxID=2953651 RepID=UPI00208FE2E1|nr:MULTISPECIES: hypothetical protein [unclassified Pseudarthrobacter]MCO4237189.1 hypothetical protein [Pseudarthrobacter sp. MDT3-28]MCO4261905.1 hypothetical protein [Pseudarthrobacter sp. MDT3-26]
MSQEKPPVRSRRELRQARDENTAPGSNGPGQVSPASKQRRAADAPVDSVPEQSQAQRSSQIRARDRAALRAIKELEEKEGQLSAGGPPTRRQLRLQQLKEQAVTSANPIIPAPMGQPLPSQPAPSQPKPGQAKLGQAKTAPTRPGHDTAVSADMAGPAAPANGAGVPAGMSVEQALAARTLIAEQAKNQLAKMEHIASLDPEAVDPDILAEQIALAERAAVLNRRAMAKRKLAEQAATAQPVSVPTQAPNPQAAATQSVPQTGPATADNLAMVTPLEFVQVPGVDRPVMKPPATSYVPLATQAGPKVRPGGKGRRPSTTSKEPAAGSAQAAASGRSRVIARAEAAARAAAAPKRVVPVQPITASTPVGETGDLFDDLPRIPARSAHGLEPLDAATAGLARAKRLRLMQVLVLAFGIVALISGVILIVSGISS